MNDDDEFFQQDADQIIRVHENKIPWWLKVTYILLPIWGLIAMYLYWNGTPGWFDPGHWQGLQEAAKTR